VSASILALPSSSSHAQLAISQIGMFSCVTFQRMQLVQHMQKRLKIVWNPESGCELPFPWSSAPNRTQEMNWIRSPSSDKESSSSTCFTGVRPTLSTSSRLGKSPICKCYGTAQYQEDFYQDDRRSSRSSEPRSAKAGTGSLGALLEKRDDIYTCCEFVLQFRISVTGHYDTPVFG
jgi:hypothetical protein